MAGESRKGVALKTEEEKVTTRLRVNLKKEDYQELMKRYDPNMYRSKSEYYRSVLLRHGEHGDIEKASSLLSGHTIALNELTSKLHQVILLYRQKFPFSRPDYMWKHVTDSTSLTKKSKELLSRIETLLEPGREKEVKPIIEPTEEQINRYKAVHAILVGYRKGTVTLDQVEAIPKKDLEETRAWVRQIFLAKLEANISKLFSDVAY